MSSNRPRPIIHPQVVAVLQRLRSLVRRYIVIDYVLTVAIILGASFWGALLLDYGPILLGGLEMPRSARAVLLIAVGIFIVIATIRLLVSRLATQLPDESLALLLERQHPELGERLLTSVQLSLGKQSDEGTYSIRLFDRVRNEAAELSEGLDIRRVFQWRPLVRKGLAAAGLALITLAFALIAPEYAKLALARLSLVTDEPWPRRSHLEMVGVEVPIVSFDATNDSSAPPETQLLEFDDRVLRLAKGGSATLRVRARETDAVIPEVCTVHYNTASGSSGQANMRRIGRPRDGFQYFSLDGPPLDGLVEDVTFSVRGLDDRLDNYRVIAIEPPGVVGLSIDCTYPSYLREEEDSSAGPDLTVSYAPGLRIREGSQLVIRGSSSKPLAKMSVLLRPAEGEDLISQAQVSDDGMEFSLTVDDFRSEHTLMLLPIDQTEITAGAPFRYYLGLVKDQAPEVQMDLVGIGNAITPMAKIPFKGLSQDDYALNETEVALNPASAETDQPITQGVQPDREGRFESEIDLRTLSSNDVMQALKPGDRLNFFAEASDHYDLGDPHRTQSDLYGLDVVSPEELLGRLEKRELGLRARLEQSIDEIRQLREVLNRIARENWDVGTEPSSSTSVLQDDGAQDRSVGVRVLRIQQTSLQTAKTTEEIIGIAGALGDIIAEMENNRVDSVDRRDRIQKQVQLPLQQVVQKEIAAMRQAIDELQLAATDSQKGPEAASGAVDSAEAVLLRLTAILDSMLDLESYNEILDIVRDLIRRQEQLIDDAKDEQKKRVLDLFQPLK